MANRYEIILEAQDKASKDLKKITAQLDKTESASVRAAKAMSRVGAGVAGAGLRAASGGLKTLTVAATAATTAFVVFGTKSINALDDLGKASTRLGVSSKFLSEYSAVANRAGISTSQFETGMQRFLRRLGQAQLGTGELVKPLERMGISIRNANGSFREGTDVFNEFIGKLSTTGTETQQLANAMGAFDTEGVAFINVAKMGAAAIDQIRVNARKAGLVINDDLIKSAEDAKDSINDLTDIGRGFGLQFFGSLAEPLNQFAKDLRDKINTAVAGAGGMEKFARTLSSKFLTGLAKFIESMSVAFDSFLDGFKTVTNVLQTLLTKLPESVTGTNFEFQPEMGPGYKSIESFFGHRIADLRVMEDLLKDQAKFGVSPGLSGQRIPLNDAAKELMGTQEELLELERQRESYNNGTLVFLEKYETGLNTIQNTTKGAVSTLRDWSTEVKTINDLSANSNGYARPVLGASTGGGAAAEIANFQKLQAAHREYAMSRIEGDRMITEEQQKINKIIATNGNRLVSSQEQANIQAKAYQAQVDAINQVLSTSVSLTADQRYQLEAISESYLEASRRLGEWGENASLVKNVTTDVTQALETNRNEYQILTNLLDQYSAQLAETGGDTDRNKAIVTRLTDELKKNEAAYSALTGVLDKTKSPMETTNEFMERIAEQAELAANSTLNMARAQAILQANLFAGRGDLEATAAQLEIINKLMETGGKPAKSDKLTPMQEAVKRLESMREEARLNPIIIEQLKQKYKLTDDEAKALGLVNAAKDVQLTRSEQIAKALGEENTQFKDLNDTLGDTSAIETLADKYGVAAKDIVAALKKARDGMDRFKTDNMTVTGIVGSTWQEMSKTMASSITQGIMSGRGVFNSFGDFLESFADRVINQILEKMLIQPMIDQMSNFASGLLGGMGGGNAGGGIMSMLGGGGLMSMLGSMGSGLWGGITSAFNSVFGGYYADGGYLPAGKVGIAGEAGPELITGPANITSNEDSFGGGGTVVNFNINAIDPSTGTQFILEHKQEITGIIQDAYNRRGRQGIYS